MAVLGERAVSSERGAPVKQDGRLEGDFRTEPDLERAMAIVHRDLAALYAPLDTDAYVSPSY